MFTWSFATTSLCRPVSLVSGALAGEGVCGLSERLWTLPCQDLHRPQPLARRPRHSPSH